MGPFGIGKNRTLPDCQNRTPARWDSSGFVKKAFPVPLKITPETLPDTVSHSFKLYELTRKGEFRPRPFRIEAKPLICQLSSTVKGLITSLVLMSNS